MRWGGAAGAGTICWTRQTALVVSVLAICTLAPVCGLSRKHKASPDDCTEALVGSWTGEWQSSAPVPDDAVYGRVEADENEDDDDMGWCVTCSAKAEGLVYPDLRGVHFEVFLLNCTEDTPSGSATFAEDEIIELDFELYPCNHFHRGTFSSRAWFFGRTDERAYKYKLWSGAPWLPGDRLDIFASDGLAPNSMGVLRRP